MLKFIVVLCRRADFTVEQFADFMRDVHRPFALKIPGLRRHVVNFPAADSTRKYPAWDAIVELYFDSRGAMEEAWRTPEGIAATRDLEAFADLTRSTWSIADVEETRL